MKREPGDTLLHFRLVEKIGAGGMGVVWRAVDTVLDREVAVKFVPEDLAADPSRLARFEREARLLASLRHPNVAVVHGLHEAAGAARPVRFLVMELVAGEDLSRLIERGPLGLERALDVARQIAGALSAAHGGGVVHRDLKPSNIRIDDAGRAKVLDFGLARREPQGAADDETRTQLTREGAILGTPAYMAPEQLRGHTGDARSDLFAFGLVLYETLTGRRPFHGENTADWIGSVLRDEPLPPSRLVPGIPPPVDALVLRLLAKDPALRYASADEVVRAIEDVRARLSTRRRRASLAAVVPALLLVGAGFLALFGIPGLDRDGGPDVRGIGQRLVSTFPGSHREPSFSADGTMIAFVSDEGAAARVWIKSLEEGDPVPVTPEDVSAGRPRWSPRGDRILYTAYDGEPSLHSIPWLGGESRRVLDRAKNGAWSPDGSRIVCERTLPGGPIWTVGADGESAREVEGVPVPDLLLCERRPSFSPDGRWIAFFHCPRSPLGDVWVVPAEGGEARRLTFDESFGGTPVFTPDGSRIVFSSTRGGSRTLWSVATSGGEPQPVLRSAGDDTDPDLSPDGSLLIYTNTRNRYRVRLVDPETGASRVLHESRSTLVDPSFSPSGDRVAWFALAADGSIQVFTLELETGRLLQVTRGRTERNIHPLWSSDGSSLFYYRQSPDPSFREVSPEGGPSREVVAGWDRQTQNGARPDPTGSRVVYTLLDGGVPRETRIRDLPTGTERRFATVLRYPRWSADGRKLVASIPNERSRFVGRVVTCEVATETCGETGGWGAAPRWSADGSRIFFLRWQAGPIWEVWSVPSAGGSPQKVVDIGPVDPVGQFFDVDREGRVVFVEFERGRGELWLADLSGGA